MKTKFLPLILLTISVIAFQSSCKSGNQKKVPIEVSQTEELSQISTIELTKDGFIENVYDFISSPTQFKYVGKEPAMIDFYATWCGPCKTFAPIVEQIATQYKGKVTVYKIDIDKEPELAALFNISAVPTVVYISKNGTLTTSLGELTKEQLEAKIEELLVK